MRLLCNSKLKLPSALSEMRSIWYYLHMTASFVVSNCSISLTETGGGNAAAIASGASADTMSVSSDRLCAASEGHVRFVNSTIRQVYRSSSRIVSGIDCQGVFKINNIRTTDLKYVLVFCA